MNTVVLVLQMLGVLVVLFTVGYLAGHAFGAVVDWFDRRRK